MRFFLRSVFFYSVCIVLRTTQKRFEMQKKNLPKHWALREYHAWNSYVLIRAYLSHSYAEQFPNLSMRVRVCVCVFTVQCTVCIVSVCHSNMLVWDCSTLPALRWSLFALKISKSYVRYAPFGVQCMGKNVFALTCEISFASVLI